VCILQGPVAAKGSMKKDKPVKELLGPINEALVRHLFERQYGEDASKVSTVGYLALLSPKSVPAELPNRHRYRHHI
jgi:fatty acid synthase subunit beta